MDLVLALQVTSFITSTAASVVLAVFALREKEKSRRLLCLKTKQTAERLFCIGLAAIVPAGLLTSVVPIGTSFALILPALIWIYTATRFAHHSIGARDGSPEDAQRLEAEFPLTPITSDEAYKQASLMKEQMFERDKLASSCGNLKERLTRTQWAYYHKLGDLIRDYGRRYPRLYCGQEWYDAVQAELGEVEGLIKRAHQLKDTSNSANAGAEEHLRKAESQFMGVDWIRSLVEGPHERQDNGAHHRLDHDLNSLPRRLESLKKSAQEAVRLLEADAAGALKYETPVLQLIAQAARSTDFLECETLLQRAISQAMEPDADTKPIDLPRALRALGQIYQSHLDQPVKAIVLYERALEQYKSLVHESNEEVTDTQADLAAALMTQGRMHEAEQIYVRLVTLFRRALPGGLSACTRAMERLGALYVRQGRLDEAEKILVLNLYICDKHDDGLMADLEKSDALDSLIALYAQKGDYKEAAKLVDRVLRLDFGRLDCKSAAELRTYAQVFSKVGRNMEVQAYNFEERAQQKKRRSDEFDAKRSDVPVWNVLRHNADRQLLADVW